KAADEAMIEMAQLVVAEAEQRYPCFKRVVEELGITGDNHIPPQEALAEAIMHVSRIRSWREARNFFGLFKGRRGINKFYSKTVRQALSRLTTAVLTNTDHRAEDEERILKKIWTTAKGKPRERLEAPA
ncbi:MAG: hypothetical protein QXI97_02865, partial [Nitrososphaerota archaeon]